MPCDLSLELEMRARGVSPVAGIDEAGRGPLAGPVVAAVVILPEDFEHGILRDSKKLSEKQREILYGEIIGNPEILWNSSQASLEEIRTLNILGATLLAMRRAVVGLPVLPGMALIDGNELPDFPVPHRGIVRGDDSSFSIAAASIIAKVERDRLMREYHEIYPEYGFASHKGYGTKDHLERLRHYGPCPIHRTTFRPVAQIALESNQGDS